MDIRIQTDIKIHLLLSKKNIENFRVFFFSFFAYLCLRTAFRVLKDFIFPPISISIYCMGFSPSSPHKKKNNDISYINLIKTIF